MATSGSKQKRTALPGGAPLSKPSRKRTTATRRKSSRLATRQASTPSAKRTSKSRKGSSSSSGKVASKPARATSKASSKKPCKYGPRLGNGMCPKKPKRATQIRRDVETIFKPSATPQQKKESATRIADAVATQVGKDAGTSL